MTGPEDLEQQAAEIEADLNETAESSQRYWKRRNEICKPWEDLWRVKDIANVIPMIITAVDALKKYHRLDALAQTEDVERTPPSVRTDQDRVLYFRVAALFLWARKGRDKEFLEDKLADAIEMTNAFRRDGDHEIVSIIKVIAGGVFTMLNQSGGPPWTEPEMSLAELARHLEGWEGHSEESLRNKLDAAEWAREPDWQDKTTRKGRYRSNDSMEHQELLRRLQSSLRSQKK